MEILKKLNYLFNRKEKLEIIYIFILIVLGSFAELLGVTIILPIVDLAMAQDAVSDNKFAVVISEVFGTDSKKEILLILVAFTILIYIFKSLYLAYMYKKQFAFAGEIKRTMSARLLKSYLKQPYPFFLKNNTADLERGVSSDVGQLYQVISNIFIVITNGLTALSIVVLLAVTNFVMTLVLAGLLSVCLCIIVFGLQKKNRKNGRENQELTGVMGKHLRQAFDGVKEIKLLNVEDLFISLYDKTHQRIKDINVTFSLYNTIPKQLVEVFAITGILGYLAYNIAYNQDYLSILPQLSVFCVAAFKLLPCVNALYAALNTIVYYKASIDLVYNDIKETDSFPQTFESNVGAEPFGFENEIKLEHVNFSYKGSDKKVLDDVSFAIKKGKTVAFIGPSGGGKTTTADIILSLLEPQEGKVLVDGRDIRENMWGWRKKLGYIPQSIYLTDDSIRKNVAFGIPDKEIDDRQIWKALEEAQMKEFVESLPRGLDTEVGERGARISGGQRQRIGIARALYRNPEVLVFDEATSALDNETEKEVMKAVDSLQGVKTIIMIAHRLSTIENCDEVYRVENGKVTRER